MKKRQKNQEKYLANHLSKSMSILCVNDKVSVNIVVNIKHIYLNTCFRMSLYNYKGKHVIQKGQFGLKYFFQ